MSSDTSDSENVSTTQENTPGRRKALVELYREELTDVYQSEANGLATWYILAQQKFYSSDFQNALIYINRAASIRETADVLALKGSIYLGLGLATNFIANWTKALEMDPDLPIPPSPFVREQLQLYGLIDENLKKSF